MVVSLKALFGEFAGCRNNNRPSCIPSAVFDCDTEFRMRLYCPIWVSWTAGYGWDMWVRRSPPNFVARSGGIHEEESSAPFIIRAPA